MAPSFDNDFTETRIGVLGTQCVDLYHGLLTSWGHTHISARDASVLIGVIKPEMLLVLGVDSDIVASRSPGGGGGKYSSRDEDIATIREDGVVDADNNPQL